MKHSATDEELRERAGRLKEQRVFGHLTWHEDGTWTWEWRGKMPQEYDGPATLILHHDRADDTLEPRKKEDEEQDAASDALDMITKLLGAPDWEYPGQVVRDVAMAVGMSMEEMQQRLQAKEWPPEWWARPTTKRWTGLKDALRDISQKAERERREEEVVHGVNCEKAEHVGGGYLHGEDDDAPYQVDGVVYCGRCHYALPHRYRRPDDRIGPDIQKRASGPVTEGEALSDWYRRVYEAATFPPAAVREEGDVWKVFNCARCDGEHPVLFHRISAPLGEWTHVGICPERNEPLVLQTLEGPWRGEEEG